MQRPEELKSSQVDSGYRRGALAHLRSADTLLAGVVDLDLLPSLADEEVINTLCQVKGIGRWTAEMFLIFSLGRLDVLAVDDLGLRAGVQRVYGLDHLPKAAELRAIAEPWRPYRTI